MLFPLFSYLVIYIYVCMCMFVFTELQNAAENQPSKPEEETMVSFVFLTSCFSPLHFFPLSSILTPRSNDSNFQIKIGYKKDGITFTSHKFIIRK